MINCKIKKKGKKINLIKNSYLTKAKENYYRIGKKNQKEGKNTSKE